MIRYKENLGSFITPEIQKILLSKTICVIGCGGNGGYILEYLIRLGVKKIIIYDGDIFEESNLNRQIYCNQNTINKNKALITFNKLKEINSKIEIELHTHFFTEKDIQKCDLIIDCADNLSKTTIEYIKNFKIPFLEECNLPTGSLVTIIDRKHEYYFNKIINTLNLPDTQSSQPAYLCAITASLAISEMIKFFCNKPCAIGYELIFDIINNKIIKKYY